jgi:N-acetylmuramoyl-L-alanine amidase
MSKARSIVVFLFLLLAVGFAQEPRWMNVYAPQANYRVDIVEHEGSDYVGLTDLMEPLGRLETHIDGGKLLLLLNGNSVEFQDGRRPYRSATAGRQELGANFFLQDGRGYIPLVSVPQLLYKLTGQAADLHISSRRLFVGNSQMHFTAELRHAPTRLVFTFPAPVNPSTVIERGRVRLFFRREPVVGSNADNFSYKDAFVTSTVYEESPEGAELIANVTQPAKVSLGEGNRTVTITPSPDAQGAAPAAQTAAPPRPVAPASGQTAETAATPAGSTASPVAAPELPRERPFVVLDASHGGSDHGTQLADGLLEKDVTLAIARRVQKELESHGMKVLMIRHGDEELNWNQRAQAANTAHGALFVSIHASAVGKGVRIYTPVIPGAQPGPNARGFLPWEAAQVPFLGQSRLAADGLREVCSARGLPVHSSAAPLRPLNSVTFGAVAVELAPLGGAAGELGTEAYQKKVAGILAVGIAGLQGKLEVAP